MTTIQLTQDQLTELIEVLDTFVIDGIEEDNSFTQVYDTLVSQCDSH